MIRIEGIPVVAARLADVQKSKSIEAHVKRHSMLKIVALRKAALRTWSVLATKRSISPAANVRSRGVDLVSAPV